MKDNASHGYEAALKIDCLLEEMDGCDLYIREFYISPLFQDSGDTFPGLRDTMDFLSLAFHGRRSIINSQ